MFKKVHSEFFPWQFVNPIPQMITFKPFQMHFFNFLLCDCELRAQLLQLSFVHYFLKNNVWQRCFISWQLAHQLLLFWFVSSGVTTFIPKMSVNGTLQSLSRNSGILSSELILFSEFPVMSVNLKKLLIWP